MPPGLFTVSPGRARQDGVSTGGFNTMQANTGRANTVEATAMTRGPWGHEIIHGGSICGLLGWAIETELHKNCTDSYLERLLCTRLTVEILSGVPVCELAVHAQIIKIGKRTAMVDASFWRADDPDKTVLARATSQWLMTNLGSVDTFANEHSQALRAAYKTEDNVPAMPDVANDPTAGGDLEYPRPGFNVDAVELRSVSGSTEDPGPGVVWVRLAQPLVAGEQPSKFAHIATLSDMGAAVGWDNTPDGGSYINTDVTLQLLRLPITDWVLFESSTISVGNGVAANHTNIYDEVGKVGWVLQSKVEAPFQLRG